MLERAAAGDSCVSDRVQVEQGRLEDLAEVNALVRAAGDAPQWPPDAWRNFVEPSSYAGDRRSVLLLARTVDGEVIGWLAASGIYETAELEYVLVHPRHRGYGVGTQLLRFWLGWVKERGALEALLEVRPSNAAALRIYRELGFTERGRRSGYYKEPAEDAVLMWLALQPGQ